MNFEIDTDDAPVVQPSPVFSKEQWLVFKLTAPTHLFWMLVYGIIVVTAYFIIGVRLSKADDKWAQSPNRDWYRAQEINPNARDRLKVSWKSCCDHSDVVKSGLLQHIKVHAAI
jgi:hypothetical protein